MLLGAALCRNLPHDNRQAAAVAASSDLSLAAHLGAVDPAPGERPVARRRHDPPGVVARRGIGWPRSLCRGPGVSRLVARADPIVRLERRALLSPVQRLAASVVGYRARPRPEE